MLGFLIIASFSLAFYLSLFGLPLSGRPQTAPQPRFGLHGTGRTRGGTRSAPDDGLCSAPLSVGKMLLRFWFGSRRTQAAAS
jgi:hypothetical protein